MLYDLQYNGCNFAEQTDCGERPICDECGENCRDQECGHRLDCSGRQDGWYPDPFSCPKYWVCTAGRAIHQSCPQGKTLFTRPSLL